MPEIGEKVVVIGSPLGLEQTAADGIVSAIRQYRSFQKVIQITAPISPGSSGSPVVNMRGEVIGVAFMLMSAGQNLNFCVPGENIANLLSGASASKMAPVVDRVYCYQDEYKVVHFVRNPDNVPSSYVLLSRPDGTLDRDRYESWVFELIGGNPEKINPEAEVSAEKERIPEHFKNIFPGHEISELNRFSPEARAYWGSWVANHFQATYNRAESTRNAGIISYRQMMYLFDRYAKANP